MIKIEGVTHWSIPVNDLDESERFYEDVLGLENAGRLPGGRMACFRVDGNNILLCQRSEALFGRATQDAPLHHGRTVLFRGGLPPAPRPGRARREPRLPGARLLHRSGALLPRPERQPPGAARRYLGAGHAEAVLR